MVHQLLSGPYSAVADPDGPDDVRNITNRSRKLKRPRRRSRQDLFRDLQTSCGGRSPRFEWIKFS
jgi:hypothetical protein